MQILMRILSVAYLAFMTFLLMVSDPLEVVDAGPLPPPWLEGLLSVAHLISFTLLAILMLFARWPIPRWLLALLLLVYAGGTEIAQTFTPTRTAEWGDLFQDLGGILVGGGVCWATFALFASRKPKPIALEAIEPLKQEVDFQNI